MKKRCISLVISILMLLSCFTMPFGTVQAAEAEGFTFTQDFTDVTIAEGTVKTEDVSAATDLSVFLTVDQVNLNPGREGDFTFNTTENGSLAIKATEQNDSMQTRSPKVRKYFDAPIKTGVLTAEISIKYLAGSGPWHLGALYSPAASTRTTQFNRNDAIYNLAGQVRSDFPTINGATKFKKVYVRLSESDTWTEKTYIVDANGKEIFFYELSYPTETHDEFTGYTFLDPYAVNNQFSAEIDDLKLVYQPLAEALEAIDFTQDFAEGKLDKVTSVAAVKEETGLTINLEGGVEGAFEFSTNAGQLTATHKGTGGAKAWVDYDLPFPVSAGKFVVNYTSSTAGAGIARDYMMGPKSNGSADAMFDHLVNADGTEYGNSNIGVGNYVKEFKNVDKKFYLQMELSRKSEDEDWVATLYNVAVPNTRKLIYRKTYAKATYSALDGIRLFSSARADTSQFIKNLDDVSVAYTSTEDIKKSQISVDFDDLADANGINEGTLSGQTGLEFVKAAEPQDITLNVKDGKVNYYVQNASNNGARLNVYYTLPAPIEKGYVEASFEYSRATRSGSEHFFIPVDNTIASGAEKEKFTLQGGASWTKWDTAGGTLVKAPVADDNGVYYLRAVWSRPDAESAWDFIIYDDRYASPSIVYKETIAAADLLNLSRIRLYTNYYIASATALDVTFDNFKIRTSDTMDLRMSYSQNFDNLSDVAYTGVESHTLENFDTTGGFPVRLDYIDAGKYPRAGIKDGKFFVDNNDIADTYLEAITKVNLPVPLYYGVIEASMKISPNREGTEGALNLFRFTNRDKNDRQDAIISFQRFDASDSFRDRYTQEEIYNGTIINEETGMVHVRAVISRPDTESNWTIKFFDDSNFGKMFGTKIVLAADLPKIDSFDFFQTYAKNLTMEVDDVAYKVSPWYADVVREEANFDNLTSGPLAEGANAALFTEKTGLSITNEQGNYLNDAGISNVTNGAIKLEGSVRISNYCPNLVYQLPANIEKGTLTASIKVPAQIVDGQSVSGFAGRNNRLFTITDVNGLGSREAIYISRGTWGVCATTPETVTETAPQYGSGRLVAQPSPAEDGAYNLRAVITRADETESWSMTVYDDTLATPKVVATRTVDMDAISKLTIANIVAIPGTDPASVDGSIVLDDVKISYFDGTEPKDMTFDEEEDEEEVVVVKENNIVFEKDYLSFSSKSGSLDNIAALTDISAEIWAYNSKGTKESFVMVLAAYNNEDRLLAVSTSSAYTPGIDIEPFNVSLEGFANANKIKVFVLSSISEMRPLGDLEVPSPAGFLE